MSRRFLSAAVTALLLIAANPFDGHSQSVRQLADLVNPYIGSISPKTGGTSPTVLVPHGMLEVSPRFTPGIGDRYLADKIYGFPVGPVSVMATTGAIQTSDKANASGFDHTLETAKAYYYQALLETPGINAGYTLTDHAIIFRFTFPKSERSNVLVRAAHAGDFRFAGPGAVEGHAYMAEYRNSIGLWEGKTFYFPFDRKLSGGFAGEEYFAECNSWIYTFSVQQDVQGLINLMGGREEFNRKLDRLFVEQPSPVDKPAFLGEFPDMSGLIGMYCQGNEPAFHIPYLYDFSGEPWKTQARVREIMQLWYNSTPFGLPGDDDGGAMSS